MKKNKNKKILFLVLVAIIVIVLILVLMVAPTSEENNTSQQTSVDLNNLEDIYANISDFDRILEKPGITQEQKENAVKNTRAFLNLCEELYINHNNELPEWNEEEKTKYANWKSSFDGYSFEDAYEYAESLIDHWYSFDLNDADNYFIGSSIFIDSDDYKFNYQISCNQSPDGYVPSKISTLRYDKNIGTSEYDNLRESSIYDKWDDDFTTQNIDIKDSLYIQDNMYVQYIGP